MGALTDLIFNDKITTCMAKTTPFLSVILPAYNETANLKRGVLDQVLAYLAEQSYSWELILSDDGSTDGTTQALQDWADRQKKYRSQIKVLLNRHAGKAQTVTAGMLTATGQWRLFSDFDQSTPLSEVEKLLAFQNDGYGIIFGSRELAGAKRDAEPWYRHLMGRGFNLLVQILAVPGVKDTQCGFKMFTAAATEKLFPAMYIYGADRQGKKDAFTGAFDVELLFLARRAQIKYKEVPIIWHHNQTDRVSPLKDSWRMLVDIIKLRLADLGGHYADIKQK